MKHKGCGASPAEKGPAGLGRERSGRLRRAGRMFLAAAGLVFSATGARPGDPPADRVVLFYNVENLFDTVNDPGVDDGEYTPRGMRRWDTARYRGKLDRMAGVIAEAGGGAVLVGLAEVENAGVVAGLAGATPLREWDYDYVHFDSPDRRGIDVALLYRRDLFRVRAARPVQPVAYGRNFLWVEGELAGRPLTVVVCHLSSNLSPDRYRSAQLRALRALADSLAGADPGRPLLIMGDLNAPPDSRDLRALGADGRLFNPFGTLHRRGEGTTAYRDRWNLFDQMLMNGPFVRTFYRSGSARIHRPARLVEREGRFRGYPRRTFSGRRYLGGYSDHFPVCIRLRP